MHLKIDIDLSSLIHVLHKYLIDENKISNLHMLNNVQVNKEVNKLEDLVITMFYKDISTNILDSKEEKDKLLN